jgi:hypothetical protein
MEITCPSKSRAACSFVGIRDLIKGLTFAVLSAGNPNINGVFG